jgi:hypothetical protein
VLYTHHDFADGTKKVKSQSSTERNALFSVVVDTFHEEEEEHEKEEEDAVLSLRQHSY